MSHNGEVSGRRVACPKETMDDVESHELWDYHIHKEFQKCLKRFPELKDIRLMVEETEELAGAAGWFGNRRIVILFVPKKLKDHPKCLVPIIYHELSHMIDKENPDKVFFERADEKSKQLWKLLQDAKVLSCIIEK